MKDRNVKQVMLGEGRVCVCVCVYVCVCVVNEEGKGE
jgi:hypothetical protein